MIAFTSEFIPKMVYRMKYSPDGSLANYTQFTLSYFNPRDFEYRQKPSGSVFDNVDRAAEEGDPEFCRYHDYRYHPREHPGSDYELTEVFWHILAARLAFVVVFQNVVGLSVMAIKMVVPNVSSELKERIRREAYLTNEIIIRTELLKARGRLDVELQRELSSSEAAPLPPPPPPPDDDEARSEEGVGGARGDGGDGEERTRLKRRITRMATGDITDGNIVW